MFLSDVENFWGDYMVFKYCDVKFLRLIKRNWLVFLDRYLFFKVK